MGFKAVVKIWQQLMGPYLSTCLEQLCYRSYQSCRKMQQLQQTKRQLVQMAAQRDRNSTVGAASMEPQSVSPTTTLQVPSSVLKVACIPKHNHTCHSFVGTMVVSIKKDNAEVTQMHADLEDFNAFTFNSTTNISRKCEAADAVSSTAIGTQACSTGCAKKPKKYISAFNYFSRFFRKATKDLNVSVSGARLNEVISAAWKSLRASELYPLDALAVQSKQLYLKQIAQLSESTGNVVKRPRLRIIEAEQMLERRNEETQLKRFKPDVLSAPADSTPGLGLASGPGAVDDWWQMPREPDDDDLPTSITDSDIVDMDILDFDDSDIDFEFTGAMDRPQSPSLRQTWLDFSDQDDQMVFSHHVRPTSSAFEKTHPQVVPMACGQQFEEQSLVGSRFDCRSPLPGMLVTTALD